MTSETETTEALSGATRQDTNTGGAPTVTAEGSSTDMGGADEDKAGSTHEVKLSFDQAVADKLLEQIHDALQQHVESIETRLEQFKTDAIAPLQEQIAALSNRADISVEVNKLKMGLGEVASAVAELIEPSSDDLPARVTKIEAQIRHMV